MDHLRSCVIGGALAVLFCAAMASSRPATQPAGISIAEMAALNKECRQKDRAARELIEAAHAALDRGDYELAVGTHRKARQAQTEADAVRRKFETAVRGYITTRLKELDDGSLKVRERATVELMQLGAWAESLLKEAAIGKSEEVQARLKLVLSKLGDLSEDEQGRLHQWASDAKASSEYSNPDWSAKQATGKPDTLQAGDQRTAWASAQADGGEEWLELTYDVAVHPVQVRIRETCSPGAVTKVEAQDVQGKWHTLWQGKDGTTECPGHLEVAVTKPTWICKVIKVTLDTSSVQSWNEIDAVELIGERP
jgi:hypothetical protein